MRRSVASLAIGGISLFGLLGGAGAPVAVQVPSLDPDLAYEAESFFTGGGTVHEDPAASGGAFVRPDAGTEFQVSFVLDGSDPGTFGIGIGYRSLGECSVQVSYDGALEVMAPPLSDGFSELTIVTTPVDGPREYKLTFTGTIDVDYCYAMAVAETCVGCEVKMGDKLLTDTSDGAGTEFSGSIGLDQFNGTGGHTFQSNPSGGYDCMGEVDPVSDELLTEVRDVIQQHPEIEVIEVQGHADDVGTPQVNKQISDRRAEAVRGWLVKKGIDPKRLAAHGYGSAVPLAPNTTEEGRAKNRRVQFVITKKTR